MVWTVLSGKRKMDHLQQDQTLRPGIAFRSSGFGRANTPGFMAVCRDHRGRIVKTSNVITSRSNAMDSAKTMARRKS